MRTNENSKVVLRSENLLVNYSKESAFIIWNFSVAWYRNSDFKENTIGNTIYQKMKTW